MSLIPVSNPLSTVVPTYTAEVDSKALGEGYAKTAKGWYKNDKGKIFVSKGKAMEISNRTTPGYSWEEKFYGISPNHCLME